MKKALVDGKLVEASPEAPEMATCPGCGGEVRKRKRRRSDGDVTWFWRHKTGVGDGCEMRYNPVGD
jgi:hypothetical protein